MQTPSKNFCGAQTVDSPWGSCACKPRSLFNDFVLEQMRRGAKMNPDAIVMDISHVASFPVTMKGNQIEI